MVADWVSLGWLLLLFQVCLGWLLLLFQVRLGLLLLLFQVRLGLLLLLFQVRLGLLLLLFQVRLCLLLLLFQVRLGWLRLGSALLIFCEDEFCFVLASVDVFSIDVLLFLIGVAKLKIKKICDSNDLKVKGGYTLYLHVAADAHLPSHWPLSLCW